MEKDPDCIGKMMFSNCSVDKMEEGLLRFLMPLEENPRVKSSEEQREIL